MKKLLLLLPLFAVLGACQVPVTPTTVDEALNVELSDADAATAFEWLCAAFVAFPEEYNLYLGDVPLSDWGCP